MGRNFALRITLAVVLATRAGAALDAAERPIAPALTGLGSLHMPVSTTVPEAQAFFNQGVRLLYAFNHQESRRAFEEAARLDPSLAMAWWGQAMTLAVNLNAPMPEENARLARDAANTAMRKRGSASLREQGLIEALATRFSADPRAARPPLDRAYASAMSRVAARYPDDADVQVFSVDAVMNTMAWDYWLKDGAFKPDAVPLKSALRATAADWTVELPRAALIDLLDADTATVLPAAALGGTIGR